MPTPQRRNASKLRRCSALYIAMLSCQTLDWCLENLGLGTSDDLPDVWKVGRCWFWFDITEPVIQSTLIIPFHFAWFCRRFPEGCCFYFHWKFRIQHIQHAAHFLWATSRCRGWGRWTSSRTSRCGCGRSIRIPWSDTTSVASAYWDWAGTVPMVAADVWG